MSQKRKKKSGNPRRLDHRVPADPKEFASAEGEAAGTGAPPAKSGDGSASLQERWLVGSICLFLAAMVWAVFAQTLSFGFLNYDDNAYITDNSVVQNGLTLKGISWALRYGGIGHWHPLTWVTHMLDCQVYGLEGRGHHLSNVLLHGATVIVLFLVLWNLTGALWRSACVAALWAVHPLRAESVAWIAERKDVLSGLFFVLTVGAYARYARQPSVRSYLAVAVLFALGLLSKNMLVTLPCVVLLVDYWPLRRWSVVPLSRLLLEKIPLFVLSAGSCVATFLVPEKVGAAEHLRLAVRLENAVVSYVIYLRQTFWPVDLAAVYPNPKSLLPFWTVGGAIALLAAISAGAILARKNRPSFLVGWFWFVGMLVPTIGVVQISYYAHADRYAYLPQMGLCLAVVWLVADLGRGWRWPRWAPAGIAAIVLAALVRMAWTQTSYWHDADALWKHTLACTENNDMAHYIFGVDLQNQGRVDEAIPQFLEAAEINPNHADTHNNLGTAYVQNGEVEKAVAEFWKAIAIQPDDAEAHYNLGKALKQKAHWDEAFAQLEKAIEIKPDYVEAHCDLASLLGQRGQWDEAVEHYRTALAIEPDNANLYTNLGIAFGQKGEMDEAIAQFRHALEIQPGDAGAHNNLGNALQAKGELEKAIEQFIQALAIRPDYAEARFNLGNAYGQKGEMDEAIAQFRQTLEIQPDNVGAHKSLGVAFQAKGQWDEAIEEYFQALKFRPDDADLRGSLGMLLDRKGRVNEAIEQFSKAVEIQPENAGAHHNLGVALRRDGRLEEAISELSRTLEIKPDDVLAMNILAFTLATSRDAHQRNGARAAELAQKANELTGGGDPTILCTLAAAYAEAGRFSEAVETAQRAIHVTEAQGNATASKLLEDDVKLYQAGEPLRDGP
jgi:tetratricopeptide (TPR) repeat protein